MEILDAYVNFNRVQSAVSKFPDEKNRNKIKKVITDDILEDAAKDGFKEPE